MRIKSTWTIFKRAAHNFKEDHALTLGAALAYYAIFSIAPLLVIATGVAGLTFSEQAAQHEIGTQLEGFIGSNAAGIVESMMAAQTRSGSMLATIIGGVTLLLAASGIFGQLKDSLNIIWRVKPRPGRGVAGLILDRFLALLMVLVIGMLLLLSMLLTTAISALYGLIETLYPIPSFAVQSGNLLIGVAVSTLLFGTIFKLLPDVRIQWRNIWVGAFCTALLFIVGEFLLSLYLGQQSTASAYGAAGSVVLVFMWVYYSSLILLFGAEFTRAHALETGASVEPGHYAILTAADPA